MSYWKVITTKIRALGKTHYFWCPGCNRAHAIDEKWKYNGNSDKPTISPSILVRGTVDLTEDECRRIINREKVIPKPLICHSFVREGNIQFLPDCTHALAGKTVEIPEWDGDNNG